MTSPPQDKSLDCMMGGLICEHGSMDCNNWRVGCASTSECLCLYHSTCCMVDAPAKVVGFQTVVRNGEVCKVGMYCCECALIHPRVLCGRAAQFCCLYGVGSLPFHQDYVDQPVCAYYFLACLPECGCCVSPPDSPALNKLVYGHVQDAMAVATSTMDREDDGTEMVTGQKGYKDDF